MKRVLIALAVLAVLYLAPQGAEVDWSFPRSGMATKQLQGLTFYDLGNNFFGAKSVIDGNETVIVVLPTNLDTSIDAINKSKPGGIPNRDQFITALAVEKAVITPNGTTNKYLGAGRLNGSPFHFYRTSNGSFVAGSVATNRSLVVLLSAPDPGPLTNQ